MKFVWAGFEKFEICIERSREKVRLHKKSKFFSDSLKIPRVLCVDCVDYVRQKVNTFNLN